MTPPGSLGVLRERYPHRDLIDSRTGEGTSQTFCNRLNLWCNWRSMLLTCFWIIGVGLCGVVLLYGFRKGRVREFPLFFAYLGWHVAAFLVQFPAGFLLSQVAWTWCTLVMFEINFLFELAMLYQLADLLIFSNSVLERRLKYFRRRVFATLILFAALVSALTPAVSTIAVRRALEHLSFAQDCFELGVLLTLLLLTRVLGFSWKSMAAGVALGWCIACSVYIASMLLLSHMRISLYLTSILREAGFNVCALVWLWYVVFPETALNTGISYVWLIKVDNSITAFLSCWLQVVRKWIPSAVRD